MKNIIIAIFLLSVSAQAFLSNGGSTSSSSGGGGSGTLTTLNSQTGAVQAFANDTNVIVTSSNDTHTLGYTGTLSLLRGGTAAALTAVNGGIPYSTASAMAILAAGTAGQLLTSGGAGVPTWAGGSTTSQVWVSKMPSATASSSHGSGGTKTALFTRVDRSNGSCITYTSDATNGDYMTINCNGVYAIAISGHSASQENFGPTVNADSTVSFNSATIAQRLAVCSLNVSNNTTGCFATSLLYNGDVVRYQDNGGSNANDDYGTFRITKLP